MEHNKLPGTRGMFRPTKVKCPKQAREILSSMYNEDGSIKHCVPHKFTEEDYRPKRPISEILKRTEEN